MEATTMTSRLFFTIGEGGSAQEAFDEAREDARYLYGGGVGPIAAKNYFLMVTAERHCPEDAEDLALRIVRENDPRIQEDAGPAGCIALDDGGYLFFGWAPPRGPA
jgi:hypothetical protein